MPGGGLAVDPQTGRLVLVAGKLVTPLPDPRTTKNTWTWDGQRWTYAGPAPDAVAGLASDPVDGELLAFTQAGSDVSAPVRDAYVWSGTFWAPWSSVAPR